MIISLQHLKEKLTPLLLLQLHQKLLIGSIIRRGQMLGRVFRQKKEGHHALIVFSISHNFSDIKRKKLFVGF